MFVVLPPKPRNIICESATEGGISWLDSALVEYAVSAPAVGDSNRRPGLAITLIAGRVMAETSLPKKADPDSKVALTRANSICCNMLQPTFPAGFIAPCLPTKTDKLPSGSQWLHEIKHDGFRVIARKNGAQVRLYSRPGNDLTHRFPLIVDALSRLRSRS